MSALPLRRLNGAAEPRPRRITETAFREATRPHLSRLLHRARRILGSEDLAWDALQETLMALWALDALPPGLHGWLDRAVVHRCLHLRRTLRRRCTYERRAGQSFEANRSPLEDAMECLQCREATERALRALDALSDEHRRVLWLRELEGLDYAAIARRLGIPVGTVRSRVSRARAAARRLLRPVVEGCG